MKYIRQRFDIDSLFAIGFIDTKTDFLKIEKRIVSFFRIKNIFEYDTISHKMYDLIPKNIFSDN